MVLRSAQNMRSLEELFLANVGRHGLANASCSLLDSCSFKTMNVLRRGSPLAPITRSTYLQVWGNDLDKHLSVFLFRNRQ